MLGAADHQNLTRSQQTTENSRFFASSVSDRSSVQVEILVLAVLTANEDQYLSMKRPIPIEIGTKRNFLATR
jgi:hypothetical protein